LKSTEFSRRCSLYNETESKKNKINNSKQNKNRKALFHPMNTHPTCNFNWARPIILIRVTQVVDCFVLFIIPQQITMATFEFVGGLPHIKGGSQGELPAGGAMTRPTPTPWDARHGIEHS